MSGNVLLRKYHNARCEPELLLGNACCLPIVTTLLRKYSDIKNLD